MNERNHILRTDMKVKSIAQLSKDDAKKLEKEEDLIKYFGAEGKIVEIFAVGQKYTGAMRMGDIMQLSWMITSPIPSHRAIDPAAKLMLDLIG